MRAAIIGEIGLSDPWHPAEERAHLAAALASTAGARSVLAPTPAQVRPGGRIPAR